MKICTRFHFEDVEPGDKLFLGGGRTQEFSDKPDPDVEITVRSAYRTVHFGEMVDATDGKTYYLDDWDIVRAVVVEPS
jgi:hypothetical protein